MALIQRYSQTQRVQQRTDPQLLLTNRLLQMSALELREYVRRESEENPALELTEEDSSASRPKANSEPEPRFLLARLHPDAEADRWLTARFWQDWEEDPDPLARVEAPRTLQEHLCAQLGAVCPSQLVSIGKYLIANVAENGYLRCSVEEAAQHLSVSQFEVDEALALLQSFEPTGVAARNLQECLMVQTQAMGEALPPLVQEILTLGWKELTSARWPALARRLKASSAEVQDAAGWIRRNLSPYPGYAYLSRSGNETSPRSLAVRPDLQIRALSSGAFSLEVARGDVTAIRLSPEYARMWRRMREQPAGYPEALQKETKELVLRAQMIVRSLSDRSAMLRHLAERLVQEQEQFLRSENDEDLRPLTQSQLASFLQVHESTVSRAVADKYLQLPSGRIVPLQYFFDRSASHRALVAQVLASENPADPYSDQQIADILRRQGVIIARRTVMKYREEMNILSSRQRVGSGQNADSGARC